MLTLFVLASCATTDLWEEIQGYADWAQSADWTGVKPSCDGTHGPYVRVWYNDDAASLVDGSASTAGEGAILVKEAYEDDGTTVKSVSAMKKQEGFDPDNGDWYWGMYDSAGNASQEGSVSGCYGCHASGTYYVRFLGSAAVDSLDDCPE